MWKRIAVAGAKPEGEQQELWADKFYDVLEDFKFVPGGRINANIGVEEREGTTLFNCYVHNPKDIDFKDPDSITGIFRLAEKQALTLKSEGGYGMNFSWLRPDGTYINGIGARTPGVVKFMELWDKSSELITMGTTKRHGPKELHEKDKIRKGAQMGVLNCWHPDIEEFITAKQTPGRLTKFNLSVGITNGFMEAVQNNDMWELKFPNTKHEKYTTEWQGDLDEWESKGYSVDIYTKIKARELWDTIMLSTYNKNEPGVLFLDLANKLNTIPKQETIQTSNPCGEIMMSTGVCNLGSINLVKFVSINKETRDFHFDYDGFKETVKVAVRFLDNINSISTTPLPEYDKSLKEKRRIGLGVMGLGSIHLMLGVRYGSEKSINLVRAIWKLKAETELLASMELGVEKGSFTLFDKDEYFKTNWWKNLEIDEDVKKEIEASGCMRNSHRSANAPTGNTSILAGVVSGGIEPVFMTDYVRWSVVTDNDKRKLMKKGLKFPDTTKGEWFETEWFKFIEKGGEQILKGEYDGVNYEIDTNRGLTKGTDVIDYGWQWRKDNLTPEENSAVPVENFATTEQLGVNEHIDVLKVVSHYTDMNSSKTVNLPNSYAYNDFKNLYMDGWKNNIKGLTTYRAGTMIAVLEEKKEIQEYQSELEEMFVKADGKVIKENVKIPTEYFSKGYVVRDKNGKKWYFNVAFADSSHKKPFAFFITTNGRTKGEVADNVIDKFNELLLSKGISEGLLEAHKIKQMGGSNVDKVARSISMALRHNISTLDIVNTLGNCHDGFATVLFATKKILSKFISDGTKSKGEECPDCGKKSVTYQEGCRMCRACGWSAC